MLKKSLLCSALAIIAAVSQLEAFAASQTNTSTTSTQGNTTVTTPTTTSTQGDTTSTTPTTTTSTQSAVNDTAIVDQVKALYQKNSLLKDKNIKIIATNHRVMLSGKVDTDMEYEQAISLAESVQGVADVDADNLLVKDSKSPLADTFITAKVKGNLMKEKLFGEKDIAYWPVNVETKNGVVYLAGNVDSNEQRNNIENLVKRVSGVKSVKSSLTVNQNANSTNNNSDAATNNNQDNYENDDNNPE
ncbi:osmotically inducible protein Y [Legionella busanensis]|uniref:Osmotically inducible protein Y n=1 Tax=Legionella busanensis TaxID=190655 RepID=A0A378JHY8_9GAMM|nr:BON domain-containing protein [Legionella busanensis]STX50805.1 osmotically inducible protein Y [Legionella busanensis]